MRSPLQFVRAGFAQLARGVRFVIQDRHDAISWLGLVLVGGGTWREFGVGWAAVVSGAVLLVFAWKGLR